MLGRIPSAVGYQPTLATDMGTMQERITTTKKGSITSVQVMPNDMLLNANIILAVTERLKILAFGLNISVAWMGFDLNTS